MAWRRGSVGADEFADVRDDAAREAVEVVATFQARDDAAVAVALRHVHDVRVRDTAEGEIVNFHCHADANLTVQAVHEQVDAVERALRQRMPGITRVIGHAEPRV